MGVFGRKLVKSAQVSENDFIHAFFKSSAVKADLLAQGCYNSEAFRGAQEVLLEKFPEIARDELAALRSANAKYIMSRAGGFNFDREQYATAISKLFAALTDLRIVFRAHGVNVTDLWQPFVDGLLAEAELTERLEG